MQLLRWVAVVALACLAASAVRAADEVKPLTGLWANEDGSTYAIRQDGDEVWWYAKSADSGDGKGWTNVFHGKIKDGKLTGQWADVPPSANSGSGSITLELTTEKGEVVKITGKGVGGEIRPTSKPKDKP
jgi:hypothetical protein